jgi:hypothetical protein
MLAYFAALILTLHCTVVTIITTRLIFKKKTPIYPMEFIYASRVILTKTATVSLIRINRLVFVMGNDGSCGGAIKYFKLLSKTFKFQRVKSNLLCLCFL